MRVSGAVAGLIATGLALVVWNRVFPVSSGNELFLADQVLQGRMPYRDFYYAVPPLTIIQYALTVAVFGRSFAALYLAGMAIRVAAITLCVWWLGRLFPIRVVAVAALVAFVAAAGDIADAPTHYHQMITAFSIAAGFCVDTAFLPGASRLRRTSWLFAAGIAVGASSLTKQTSGPLIAMFLVGGILFYAWHVIDRQSALEMCAAFLTGIAVIAVTVGLWLATHQALVPFVRLTLVAGPSSKGGLVGALGRIGWATWGPLRVPFIAATTLLMLLGVQRFPNGRLLILCVAALLAMLSWVAPSPRLPQLASCYIAFLGSGVVAVMGLSRFWSTGDLHGARISLAGLIGFGTALGLALSWPAYEPMILPGFTIVAGAIADQGRRRAFRSLRWFGGAVLALILAASAVRKITIPFSWGDWQEPPLTADRGQTSLPELRGLSLARSTVVAVESTTMAVRARALNGDRLLVFPLMANFYALTGLPPATYAYSHFIDICPDSIAAADAASLYSDPPAFFILQPVDNQTLASLEYGFRDGKDSGERAVQRAIVDVISRDHYVLVHEWKGDTGPPIQVWARPDRLRLGTAVSAVGSAPAVLEVADTDR